MACRADPLRRNWQAFYGAGVCTVSAIDLCDVSRALVDANKIFIKLDEAAESKYNPEDFLEGDKENTGQAPAPHEPAVHGSTAPESAAERRGRTSIVKAAELNLQAAKIRSMQPPAAQPTAAQPTAAQPPAAQPTAAQPPAAPLSTAGEIPSSIGAPPPPPFAGSQEQLPVAAPPPAGAAK